MMKPWNGPSSGVQVRTRVSRPGPVEVDRRRRSRTRGGAPSAGSAFSCVPQPISAGWLPSDTKPSIDQVLTNSPTSLGCVRDLGVALGDVDHLDAEVARQLRPSPRGWSAHAASCRCPRARLTSACFTKCETRPGLAPWAITAVGPPRYFGTSFSMVSRSA